jgi:hypothetical protein
MAGQRRRHVVRSRVGAGLSEQDERLISVISPFLNGLSMGALGCLLIAFEEGSISGQIYRIHLLLCSGATRIRRIVLVS